MQIAYYLRNRDLIEAYLNQREQLAESVKQRLQSIQPDLSQIRYSLHRSTKRDRNFPSLAESRHNASYDGVIAACDRSLSRLKTDYLDLYLLYWRGSIPLSETLKGLQHLNRQT